jgi:folate-binding protein YgfZ
MEDGEMNLVTLAASTGDILHLAGKEPFVALDRIVSQEVRSLVDGHGRLALLLAPKGQFRALMAVFRASEEALVLAPRGHGGELAAQLGSYLRFSRVAVEPLDWLGGCEVVAGPGWRGVAAALGADPERVAGGGCTVVGGAGERLVLFGQTFTGGEGATICAESEIAGTRLDETLRSAGAAEVDETALELARVCAGFPAWGKELTDNVLPPEVGLDAVAISYTKGCYVGQETIARLKTYGHANRTLVRVRQCGGPDLRPDLPLPLAREGDGKAQGQLTSCERHPERGWLGLALVRRELATPGSLLVGARYAFGVLAPGD